MLFDLRGPRPTPHRPGHLRHARPAHGRRPRPLRDRRQHQRRPARRVQGGGSGQRGRLVSKKGRRAPRSAVKANPPTPPAWASLARAALPRPATPATATTRRRRRSPPRASRSCGGSSGGVGQATWRSSRPSPTRTSRASWSRRSVPPAWATHDKAVEAMEIVLTQRPDDSRALRPVRDARLRGGPDPQGRPRRAKADRPRPEGPAGAGPQGTTSRRPRQAGRLGAPRAPRPGRRRRADPRYTAATPPL